MLGFKERDDNTTNAAMDVMVANEEYQDSPSLGIFWYDTQKNELFGVESAMADDVDFYMSPQWNKEVRTGRRLHKNVWEKQFYRKKDKRFSGDYTQVPRGRVFEFRDEGFVVFTGKWIEDYPEAKEEIMFEFQLPEDNTKFIQDEHWDLGHGWSNEF